MQRPEQYGECAATPKGVARYRHAPPPPTFLCTLPRTYTPSYSNNNLLFLEGLPTVAFSILPREILILGFLPAPLASLCLACHDSFCLRLLTSACKIPDSSNQSPGKSDHNDNAPVAAPAVRFASKVEQYDVDGGHSRLEPTKQAPEPSATGLLQNPDVTPEQIKALSQSLADTNLQEQRMKSFSYQAFSLPPSRVREPSPASNISCCCV